MFDKLRAKGRKPSRPPATPSDTPKPRFGRRRVFDVALLVLVVAVVGYLALFAVKVGRGYSRTLSVPEHTVRLQIVNASGTRGLSSGVVARLKTLSDLELTVQVVDMSYFDVSETPYSFVVSREADCSAARLLAQRLGLDPDKVEYKELEHNTGYVTASLILGRDTQEKLLSQPPPKEKT